MEKQTIETNVIKPKLSIFSDEVEYRLISSETEKQLDKGIDDIESFMVKNHGYGQPDEIKDQLYTDAKILWNKYAEILRESKYTFYLNRKQYSFLTTLLRDKLEYDVNTIFLAIELTNMLGDWVSSEKHKSDKELKGYTSDATEVTYMYHLIAKHKVIGLTSNSYLFAEILKKIGDISKIISYYDTAAKNLSKSIQEWVGSFEPQDQNIEKEEKSDSIKAKKVSPKEIVE